MLYTILLKEKIISNHKETILKMEAEIKALNEEIRILDIKIEEMLKLEKTLVESKDKVGKRDEAGEVEDIFLIM